MKKTSLLWLATLLPTVLFAQNNPPAQPAAEKPAETKPALSPEEAKKRLSLALGTYFANQQKNQAIRVPLDYAEVEQALSDVLGKKSKSYALGARFAGQLMHDDIDINISDLMAAFKAALDTKDPLLTQEEVNAALQELSANIRAKAQAAAEEEGKKNDEQARAFLEKNKNEDGVQVTASGLQYKVLEPAKDPNAPRPTADDTVVCHYKGTLLDGTQFDASPEGQPRTFNLRSVIKGWTEGIPLMQVGSKYRFWIPAALAYGNNPRPGSVIRPGHTLVFDIDLVEIKPKPAPKATSSTGPKPDRGEKAVATTPPIAVEMKDGKAIVRQVTPEEEEAAKKKAAEETQKKEAEKKAEEKPAEQPKQ